MLEIKSYDLLVQNHYCVCLYIFGHWQKGTESFLKLLMNGFTSVRSRAFMTMLSNEIMKHLKH